MFKSQEASQVKSDPVRSLGLTSGACECGIASRGSDDVLVYI